MRRHLYIIAAALFFFCAGAGAIIVCIMAENWMNYRDHIPNPDVFQAWMGLVALVSLMFTLFGVWMSYAGPGFTAEPVPAGSPYKEDLEELCRATEKVIQHG